LDPSGLILSGYVLKNRIKKLQAIKKKKVCT